MFTILKQISSKWQHLSYKKLQDNELRRRVIKLANGSFA